MSRRTWAELQALYADNTTGDIGADDLRDGFDSVTPHVASSNPTTVNNQSQGFDRGHVWIDTSTSPFSAYDCLEATEISANWHKRPMTALGILDGEGTPSDAVGENGEWYIDTLSIELYGPKEGGTWPTPPLGLKGEDGEPGPVGPPGADGGGASDFLDLTDSPAAYTSAEGMGVFVNSTPDGLEFGLAMRIVQHGAVAATARPDAACVYWLGSVAPTNRQTGDLWLETGAFD